MSNATSRPRRLFRISLATLLLISTCVAMGLGMWRASQQVERYRNENAQLTEENKRLRGEYGEFDVTDPSRLYANEIRTSEAMWSQLDWGWRIAIPEGKRFVLNYIDGTIPAKKFPKPKFTRPLGGGTYTIRVDHFYDPNRSEAKAWRVRIMIHQSGKMRSNSVHSMAMEPNPWSAIPKIDSNVSSFIQQDEVGIFLDSNLSQSADKRLVLQRFRLHTVDKMTTNLSGNPQLPDSFDHGADAPGFLIWLEPLP